MSTPKDRLKKSVEANLTSELPPGSSPAQRTFGQSWLAIPRRTRLFFSCALFGTALVGLWVSDKVEEKLPASKPANTSSRP
ncbi:hypothetical protein EW145_g2102 [Phellinidium pouzarii]|uniref:Uncharacterized protein n=1 Tax=Phellinidium pouzarii TaxID=167371 RepID=A0A4S4LCM7_9AGAM|nr:hypothetical protein EW145_g2102 [Phellinidium pouzarii]